MTRCLTLRNRSLFFIPASVPALPACALIAALNAPANAGGVSGMATEWTQLLNNAELAQIVATESAILATDTESLAAQLDQLRTELAAFGIMQRNIKSLPEHHLRQAMDRVVRLHRVAGQAGAIARSGAALDDFLRSDLITDPLYDRRGLERNLIGESYTAWNNRWHASMETGLRGAGMTLEDVESEAQLIDRISARLGTEAGQMQVLQGANQIAASMARQMNDLRALTATQSETVTVAWGRVLADMDRREAEQRRFEREVHETIESYQNAPRGRSMNEIFGIGQ